MPDVDDQRRAVLYVALAQQVLPALESSTDKEYADKAIDLCWRWIEQRDVSGLTLYELFHDDEDYGVEPAMSVEFDQVKWSAWACVAQALAYTGRCAYVGEGSPIPESFSLATLEEAHTEFMDGYQVVTQNSRVPQLLGDYLEQLPDGQLTQAVIRDKLVQLSANRADTPGAH